MTCYQITYVGGFFQFFYGDLTGAEAHAARVATIRRTSVSRIRQMSNAAPIEAR